MTFMRFTFKRILKIYKMQICARRVQNKSDYDQSYQTFITNATNIQKFTIIASGFDVVIVFSSLSDTNDICRLCYITTDVWNLFRLKCSRCFPFNVKCVQPFFFIQDYNHISIGLDTSVLQYSMFNISKHFHQYYGKILE